MHQHKLQMEVGNKQKPIFFDEIASCSNNVPTVFFQARRILIYCNEPFWPANSKFFDRKNKSK